MKKYLPLFFVLIMVVITCKKAEDKKDPFDPANIDPAEWAPSNLQIEQLSVSSVKLSWEDNCTFEDGFKIDRKVNNQEWIQNYKTINSSTNFWNDTSVLPNQQIEYRLYAYKGNFNSSEVEKIVFIAFDAPTHLSLQMPTPTSIEVIWQDNSDGEDGFRVDKKVNNSPWQNSIGETSGDINNWIDTDIAFGLTIRYKVYAFYGDIKSDTVSGEIVALIPSPSNLQIYQTGVTQASLTWIDSCGFEQSTIIDKKVGNNEWENRIVALDENTTSWLDENAVYGQTNYYRIYNTYHEYESTRTESDILIIIPAPSDLTIQQIGIRKVNLTWLDESSFEEGFKIDRKVGEGNWVIGYGNVNENENSWDDEEATFAQTNYYRIYAFNGQHNSDYISNSIDVKLESPSFLQLQQIDATVVKLTWNDNSNFEEGFRIDRKDGTGSWNTIGTVAGNITTWQDHDAPFGQGISYKVYAYAGSYISDDVHSNIFLTIPSPTNLNLQNTGVNNVIVSWNDNCLFEDGYKIDRKIGAGTWENELATLSPNTTSWIDHGLPFNEIISYRVYAYSNEHLSDDIEANIELSIAPPTNLDIIQTDLNSIKLTWQDNCSFEEGFIIDRKIENEDWVLNYGTAIANQTEWIDNIIYQNKKIIYKIRAFFENENSEEKHIAFITESFESNFPNNWFSPPDETGFIIDNTSNKFGEYCISSRTHNGNYPYVLTTYLFNGGYKIGFWYLGYNQYANEIEFRFNNQILFNQPNFNGFFLLKEVFGEYYGSGELKWIANDLFYIDDIIIVDYNPVFK